MSARRSARALRLLLPRDGVFVSPDSGLAVSWLEEWNTAHYRVELETEDGAGLFSAVVPPGVGAYRAPPFVLQQAAGKSVRWRVTALDFNGSAMRHSAWRTVKPNPPPNAVPTPHDNSR